MPSLALQKENSCSQPLASPIYHGQGIYYLGSQRCVGHELLLRRCAGGDLADMLATPSLFVDHLDDLFASKLNHAKRLIKNSKKRQRIFINFSPSQISAPGFLGKIEDLRQFSLKHGQVVIEVTEYENLCAYPQMLSRLNKAKGSGIEIALDDFGAGYANLESLSELKPSFVKIDREILLNSTKTKFHENLVYSLVNFIHNLGIKTVLEGVETLEHFKIALQSRAELGQGFFLQKPGPI